MITGSDTELEALIARKECIVCHTEPRVAWGGTFGVKDHVLRCGCGLADGVPVEPVLGKAEHPVDKRWREMVQEQVERMKEGRMPIIGVTDVRRLPRLGKIRTGIKVTNANGKEYPKAVDYFVSPEEIKAVYGEQPRELDIMFPVEDEDVFASAFYRAYSQSRGLVCKGDGSSASRMIDITTKAVDSDGVITGAIADHKAKDVEWIEGLTCPGRDCQYYQQKACREVMNLQFILPKVPGLGVWQLDTSSYHSIVSIYSSVALIRSLFGRVAGIPLLLTIEPREVAPDGRKKTVNIIYVRANQTLNELANAKSGLGALSLPPSSDMDRPDLLYGGDIPDFDEDEEPDSVSDVPDEHDDEPRIFQHVGEFLSAAYETWGVSRADVCVMLQKAEVSEIGGEDGYADHWKVLEAAYGTNRGQEAPVTDDGPDMATNGSQGEMEVA